MTHPHARNDHGRFWQQAEDYAQMAERAEPALRPLTEAMLDAANVRAGTRLLDLACGPGFTTGAAAARGADAFGIDVTPQMVEAAKRRFPHARFAVADMLQPPPGPWDAIVSRFAVHHADPAWAPAAFQVLANGGRLAIAELPRADGDGAADGMQDPSHWVGLLRETGFEGIRIMTVALAGTSGMPGTKHVGEPQGRAYVVAASKPT